MFGGAGPVERHRQGSAVAPWGGPPVRVVYQLADGLRRPSPGPVPNGSDNGPLTALAALAGDGVDHRCFRLTARQSYSIGKPSATDPHGLSAKPLLQLST